MNDIAVITKQITDEGELAAQKIRQEGQVQRDLFLAAERRRIGEEHEHRLAQMKEKIAADENTRMGRKKDYANREILLCRQELMDDVFHGAELELANLTKAELLDFFAQSVESCGLSGDCQVFFGAENQAQVEKADLVGLFPGETPFVLHLSPEPMPGVKGFVIEQPPVEYDFRFHSLLAELRGEKGAAILKRLFD